jgi:predicted nuclease of predicted toxin-antitoxin system
LLVSQLREAGHDVRTVNDAGLQAANDDVVLGYAITQNRIVLTQNCADFAERAAALSKRGKNHPGILLVHQDNDSTKDMSVNAIVKAIRNLEQTRLALANQVIALNKYNYKKR